MTGTLKVPGRTHAVGAHKGRAVMEGFTEEVAVELGLKGWTEFTSLEECPENVSAPAIVLPS